MTAKKKTPANYGWEVIEGTHEAEKTASFGSAPLKTHRLAGADEEGLMRNIEDFEARLKAVNGAQEVAEEAPAEEADEPAADEPEDSEVTEEGEDG